MVAFDIPCMIDGISSSSYNGVGIVIDASKGLVLVDQNTVPIALGDVVVTVAASIETPAKVLFVHPVHNFSIIQYDPALLGDTRLESAELSDEVLQVGDQVDFVGLTSTWTVVAMKSLVTKIDRLVLRDFQPPRYKASNVEVIHFDRITKSVGGIFVDSRGLVTALWLSFSYQDEGGRREVFRGLSVEVIREVVNMAHSTGVPRSVTVLPIQLYTYPLSKARAGLGLSPHWIRQLEQCYGDKRQVLAIKRCSAGSDAAAQLQSGDLLLSIDGNVVAKDFDVELLCMKKPQVSLVILREQKELTLTVSTMELSGWGTSRVITWCGLVIQEPHYAVVNLGYLPEEGGGVYCSRWCYGSPAHKYGLRATMWIVQVNNEPTPTLDAFIKVVENLQNGASVRMKTIALNTKPKVLTLKTDYHYWPTVELCRDPNSGDWEYVFHPNKP
ncbi:pro-apoptotic serine protease [Thraustotheca clavata]|uniref:Pro-apoptotic serine protease n=1 Tax=Thraustotheca clavata TaxID=74557 RepID=A0A1V9ZCQ9_9STRA|nr:pro-apoptotic serine protease [Thraustotheca clavata]